MTNAEIIELLKQIAIDNFTVKNEDKRILPSILIAKALITLETFAEEDVDTLVKANNPFAIIAGKNYKKETVTINETRYKVFNNIADAIALVTDYTDGELSYEEAVKKLDCSSEEEINKYISIIAANKLNEIDNAAIETLYASGKTIVETEAVKKESTEIKEETPISTPTKIDTPATITNDTQFTGLVEGAEIKLYNAHLYESPTATRPLRAINGSYCLSDGVNRNYRYAVCRAGHVGDPNFIIGYVKKEQISK